MKLLSSLVKRIEIVVFVLSFLAVLYVLVLAPVRYWLTWHALPKSTEPIAKILSANFMGEVIVQTIHNNKFVCNLYQEKECWTKVEYNPIELGTNLCFMQDCPDSHILQMRMSRGQSHSFGGWSTTYSLHHDGIIYVKQTGFVWPDGYIMSAIIGGFCAFVTFLGKHLLLGVISLFQKGRIE